MSLLILMRHGQSMWNAAGLFTGWVDVPLTPIGIDEAETAVVPSPTSPLTKSTLHPHPRPNDGDDRPVRTRQRQNAGLPVPSEVDKSMPENERSCANGLKSVATQAMTTCCRSRAWQLNERMYGDLQGLNKDALREKYGADQVHIWRRSYDVPPPGGESSN